MGGECAMEKIFAARITREAPGPHYDKAPL